MGMARLIHRVLAGLAAARNVEADARRGLEVHIGALGGGAVGDGQHLRGRTGDGKAPDAGAVGIKFADHGAADAGHPVGGGNILI